MQTLRKGLATADLLAIAAEHGDELEPKVRRALTWVLARREPADALETEGMRACLRSMAAHHDAAARIEAVRALRDPDASSAARSLLGEVGVALAADEDAGVRRAVVLELLGPAVAELRFGHDGGLMEWVSVPELAAVLLGLCGRGLEGVPETVVVVATVVQAAGPLADLGVLDDVVVQIARQPESGLPLATHLAQLREWISPGCATTLEHLLERHPDPFVREVAEAQADRSEGGLA